MELKVEDSLKRRPYVAPQMKFESFEEVATAMDAVCDRLTNLEIQVGNLARDVELLSSHQEQTDTELRREVKIIELALKAYIEERTKHLAGEVDLLDEKMRLVLMRIAPQQIDFALECRKLMREKGSAASDKKAGEQG